MQVALDEHVDADPDDDDREQDRERGRERPTRAASEQPAHRSEHEADAPHRLDQRRLAELPPQVRDVAIDRRSRLAAAGATPDPLERQLAR